MKYFFFCFLLSLTACLKAQVSVHDEPRHKTVLLNDYVRLIDVHLPSGDTTLYHVHAAPSVIVHITKSLIGAQPFGGTAPAPGEVLPAQTRYAAYDKNPITHRVYNASKDVFHVMDIELIKTEPSPDSCAVIQAENVETTINEKLVRVYKIDLNNKSSINIPQSSCAHLLICISGNAIAEKKHLKSGDYIFYDSNTKIELANNNSETAICVLLELK